MVKKFVILGLGILIIILLATFLNRPKSSPTQSNQPPASSLENQSGEPSSTPGVVHNHASFLIFTNGTQRDFSDPKYHNQLDDIFIEAENPAVVHSYRAGVTWQEFFDTLPEPFRLTEECLYTGTGQTFCDGEDGRLQFYRNRELAQNLLTQEIRDGDQVLVTFGTENEQAILTQLNVVPEP